MDPTWALMDFYSFICIRWISMTSIGVISTNMDSNRLLWIPMNPYIVRISIDSCRFHATRMEYYGFLWVPMDYGSTRISMNSSGFQYDPMDAYEFLWIPTESDEFQWIPKNLHSIGFQQIPRNSYGFLRIAHRLLFIWIHLSRVESNRAGRDESSHVETTSS